MEIKKHKIGIVGAGKLVSRLLPALSKAGIHTRQLISLEGDKGKELAGLYGAEHSTRLKDLKHSLDILIIAVPDETIPEIVQEIPVIEGVTVHTSGAVSIDVFEGLASGFGVLYPLQTFSTTREVDFSTVPIFIEAGDDDSLTLIRSISGKISKRIYEVDSENRTFLHLAAVFANNFTNHLLAVSSDILKHAGVEREVLNELVRETIEKTFEMEPLEAQTGPALRGDDSTIKKHLNLLSFSNELCQLYKCLTKSIQKYHSAREADN